MGNTVKNLLVWLVLAVCLMAAFNAITDKQESQQQTMEEMQDAEGETDASEMEAQQMDMDEQPDDEEGRAEKQDQALGAGHGKTGADAGN